jgi:hypothetical protein
LRAITEARPTFLRGFLTRLAVIAATSTPMKENSATLAAIPMQLYRLPPEALNGPKLALEAGRAPVVLDIESPCRKYAPPYHAGRVRSAGFSHGSP